MLREVFALKIINQVMATCSAGVSSQLHTFEFSKELISYNIDLRPGKIIFKIKSKPVKI
jgi:hypothetical protein